MVDYTGNITGAERKMAQSSIELFEKHEDKLNENGSNSIEISLGDLGKKIHIPAKAFDLLKSILGDMAEGRKPKFVTHDIEMNVQQISQLLRFPVSYINRLLDSGKIPHRTSDEERYVLLSDALSYDEERKKRQLEGVQALIEEAQELKLGY